MRTLAALMTTTAALALSSGSALAASPAGYGKLCQGQSKQHVKGEKGTPFADCVKAMAQAAKGSGAKAACKALSKKHVKGEKGTPFSRCVAAAAKATGGQAGAEQTTPVDPAVSDGSGSADKPAPSGKPAKPGTSTAGDGSSADDTTGDDLGDEADPAADPTDDGLLTDDPTDDGVDEEA